MTDIQSLREDAEIAAQELDDARSGGDRHEIRSAEARWARASLVWGQAKEAEKAPAQPEG